MSVTGLLFAFALSAALLVWVLLPLLRGRDRRMSLLLDRQRERALAFYERALTNVHDLDEDHATGKISPEEYQAERAFWVDQGVRVLKLLDELDERHQIVDDPEADDRAIDEAIEAIVSARRPQFANQHAE